MKNVPFYGNTSDDRHCAVAVQRSIVEYFTGRKLNWKEAEQLANFQNGKVAWTVDIWTRLAKQGFDIKMIEPFDYHALEQEGESYLHRIYPPEVAAWQVANTNVLELKHLNQFLQTVAPVLRQAVLPDIDHMLDEGRLVSVVLNSRALNDKPGYEGHAVLIFDKQDDDYILHDPGLPPHPNRRVAKSKLWQAMGGDKHTAEVTGIKLHTKPIRADVLLAGRYPQYSRAALAKLFAVQAITLNGEPLKAGEKVKPDAPIVADLSILNSDIPQIDLPILHEDNDCLVVNKPAGVLTHALGKHGNEPSVASFLRGRTKLSGDRAGIVHRLDRATSGVLICAKNQNALSFLQKQFAARKVKKTYVAMVKGEPKESEALIDMPIERNPKAPSTFRVGANGKSAQTHYRVVSQKNDKSLVELTPETGRTHQLRIHLAKIGHPIIGDPVYGDGKYGDRLMLHALSLELTLPGGERKTFKAPLPKEFNV